MRPKQKKYFWTGLNPQGKTLSGELHALTPNHLKIKLKQQGIILQSIRRWQIKKLTFKSRKPCARDFMIFFRQLSTLILSGIPLSQSLEVLKNSQEKPVLQSITYSLKTAIESGKALSDSMQQYPKYFDAFTCQLIKTGEQTGTLDTLLLRIADHQENLHRLKIKIKQALFYPSVVITLAFIIFFTMLLFIVPKFAELFTSFHGQLPTITKTIIVFSNSLRHIYFWIFVSLACCFLSILFRLKIISLNKIQYFITTKMPFIRHLFTKVTLARFARSLSIILMAGIPLAEALKFIALISTDKKFTQVISTLHSHILSGKQLHFAMQTQATFPLLMIQLVKVGEESGTLEKMLEKLAVLYEADVDLLITQLTQLLEPLIMVILGVLIGGLVIAMYLPIFKLGNII